MFVVLAILGEEFEVYGTFNSETDAEAFAQTARAEWDVQAFVLPLKDAA